MLNSGKSDQGTVINCGSNTITIWPDTITTGTICVRNNVSRTLWQKVNCDYIDLHTAIEVAKLGIQTDVFES